VNGRSPIEPHGIAAVRIRLKVVPGAACDEIAGVLGDRLKVRVSAPPEGGRANKAVCALLAAALSLPRRNVEVVSGHASAEKIASASGIDADRARAALGCP
jgi:uncharacterized protein (TIGR00251 family)